MKRLLTLLAVMVMGAVGVRTQGPTLSNGALNGLAWRAMPQNERMAYLNGVEIGFMEGGADAMHHMGDGHVDCMMFLAENLPSSWFYKIGPTTRETAQAIDGFYSEAANIALPIATAYVYTRMQFAGASKAKLDEYRSTEQKGFGLK